MGAEDSAGSLHGVRDLIGNDLSGPAESRGRHDMRVDALLGDLQVQFALDLLAVGFTHATATPLSRRLPRGLLVDPDETGWRLGEASVMGLERTQHAADGPVALGPALERIRNIAARFDNNGNDDVAEPLALRLAHHPPDGLDDIDLAVSGIEKGDGIQFRNIDALGEELDVADHPALGVGVEPGQPAQFLVALQRACGGVQVPRDKVHCPPVRHAPGGRTLDLAFLQGCRVPLRAADAVGKGHGAPQTPGLVQVLAFGHAVDRQRNPEHAGHLGDRRRLAGRAAT